MEKLQRENEYMDHILMKVKNHFNLEKDSALIDIELFLSKIKDSKRKWEAKRDLILYWT